MMDQSFEFILHLFTYGKIHLPGIGKLQLKKFPAKRMVHEGKLYGPTLSIDFKQDVSEAAVNETGDHSTDNKIQKTITKIINDLLNFGESRLVNFGYFQKLDDGQINFEPDPDLQKTFSLNYPDLAISFLPDKKKQLDALAIKTSRDYEFESTKKTKIGWFFPLLALFATSLLLACLVTCFLQKKFDSAFTPIIRKDTIEQEQADPTITTTPIISDSTNQRYVDTVTDSEKPDDLFETENEELPEYPEISDSSIDEMETPPVSVADVNFNNIEQLSLDYVLRESAIKRLSYNDPCIIVVGSYLRRDLLNGMVTTLNQLDYAIYIEKYGSFYRTAIIYECETKNRSEFLSYIRMELEPKAWILEY